jgi:hypothetical protein
MRVKLEETPLDLRRRVANKLETLRGTAMAPGGDNARLGDFACPVYRPDIKDVAYWEFEIAGLKEVRSRERDGKSSGLGFMLASTGGHDLPIPHFSLTAESPSHALEGKAPDSGVSRIIKLDTLAYAAEDANGKYLAHLGQLPLQVVGAPADMTKLRGISSIVAAPATPAKSDDGTPPKLVLTSEGVKVPKIKLSGWETWPAAKRGYAKAYKPHLAALAARAADAWKVEDLITAYGEGIREGKTLTVPLLKAGKAAVEGDGAKLVKLTSIDRNPPAVMLEALHTDEKKEVNFQLVISYTDGSSEKLFFFVLPDGTPSNHRSILPHFSITPNGGNGS